MGLGGIQGQGKGFRISEQQSKILARISCTKRGGFFCISLFLKYLRFEGINICAS